MNTETTIQHTNIFDNKEQYLAFRAKWRQLHAEGFHKKVKHEYRHGPYTFISRDKWTDGGPGYHMESPLNAAYHLVFNLAIGRDPSKAFGKTSNRYKLQSLFWQINSQQYAEKFFSVFGDVLTDEQKVKVQELAKAYIRTL